MSPDSIELSVVVPLYNEEESVPRLSAELIEALQSVNRKFEILFVDDGSTDATFDLLYEIALQDERIRVIKFRRNFGQTPAMAAGIDNSRGRIIVTMDGDLQNDPRDIALLVSQIELGHDLVVGWRHSRQDKLITRKLPSRVANWLIGKVTGVPIKDNGCSLKAYRCAVIKDIPLYSEMHRFIPAMASIAGARIKEVKVRHHARRYGVSKYGLSRVFRVLVDLLTIKTLIAFGARPLAWFTLLSVMPLLISIGLLSYVGYEVAVQGRPISFVYAGVALVFGALAGFLMVVGVLCELIYRTGDLRMENLPQLTTSIDRSGPEVRP